MSKLMETIDEITKLEEIAGLADELSNELSDKTLPIFSQARDEATDRIFVLTRALSLIEPTSLAELRATAALLFSNLDAHDIQNDDRQLAFVIRLAQNLANGLDGLCAMEAPLPPWLSIRGPFSREATELKKFHRQYEDELRTKQELLSGTKEGSADGDNPCAT